MRILTIPFLTVLLCSCAPKAPGPGLPSTKDIGTFRGRQYLRTETHFHGPFSYDACDDQGLTKDGKITEWCLRDFRYGLCYNRVDVVFATDHLSNIGNYPFEALLMHQPGDTLVRNKGGKAIANLIKCEGGHSVLHSPGFEGPLIALGMENRVSDNRAEMNEVLGHSDSKSRDQLERWTKAVVGVPHTESRTLDEMRELKPTFIEVYNLHAQLHPRMRKEHLGLSPYAKFPGFIKYLLDPFRSLNADYMFMEFLEYNQHYFDKWNTLLSEGLNVWGTGGLDSHENVLKMKGADGERLDAHRRMTRFMSNLVLADSNDLQAVKEAIRKGRIYVVIEGLGTPVGFDFRASTEGSNAVTEMGETLQLDAAKKARIEFQLPQVHPQFEGMIDTGKGVGEKPEIEAELHYIDPAGKESVVAKTSDPVLTYVNLVPGHYRMHVWIKPHHLRPYIARKILAGERYQWMISNPIRVKQ